MRNAIIQAAIPDAHLINYAEGEKEAGSFEQNPQLVQEYLQEILKELQENNIPKTEFIKHFQERLDKVIPNPTDGGKKIWAEGMEKIISEDAIQILGGIDMV